MKIHERIVWTARQADSTWTAVIEFTHLLFSHNDRHLRWQRPEGSGRYTLQRSLDSFRVSARNFSRLNTADAARHSRPLFPSHSVTNDDKIGCFATPHNGAVRVLFAFFVILTQFIAFFCDCSRSTWMKIGGSGLGKKKTNQLTMLLRQPSRVGAVTICDCRWQCRRAVVHAQGSCVRVRARIVTHNASLLASYA